MKSMKQVVIIGGGLSGLALSYFLSKEKIPCTIIEASNRLGGRIQTVKGELDTPLELGATWFSDFHVNFLELIAELSLSKYPQFSGGISLFQTKSFEPPQKFFVPEADQPSYRLVGGTQVLIDTLARRLNPNQIYLNQKASVIRQTKNGISVETNDGKFFGGDKVIICIPAQLISNHIEFAPALPETITQLLPNVQTWMAGAIKFTLEYDRPFWRQAGYSGMLYSHAGIITEMYDHTNFEANKFGFTGFLNGGAVGYTLEVRKNLVLSQLSELFGDDILQPTAYYDKIWNDEYIIAGAQVIQRPHQNNGHPALHSSYMDGKLHFCGTETAKDFSGYMEGAIRSARLVANHLLL
jgi:monoamine oxidase